MPTPWKVIIFSTFLMSACGGDNTSSTVTAPGRTESTKTKILETGADVLQDKTPIHELNAYMDGFHFYNGNMQGQMEAHHYCGHLNEDVIQCVIYDANEEKAKLMGVEYIISKALFSNLATDEKQLWHSHVHEVKSGSLIAPGIPEAAEHEFMEKIASTYGKTWHTWHTDMHTNLPLGIPMLMMGFTADGQLNPVLLQARDKRFKVSALKKKEQRANIVYPAVDPNADAWQKGRVIQMVTTTQSRSEKK